VNFTPVRKLTVWRTFSDGQTTDVLAELVTAGSSAGARPKAQLYLSAGDYGVCRTRAKAGDEAWLVKFTSANLPLRHEEGLCEAVCLSLAERAGLQQFDQTYQQNSGILGA
jgi:serine/threonine-protein kinase HipA